MRTVRRGEAAYLELMREAKAQFDAEIAKNKEKGKTGRPRKVVEPVAVEDDDIEIDFSDVVPEAEAKEIAEAVAPKAAAPAPKAAAPAKAAAAPVKAAAPAPAPKPAAAPAKKKVASAKKAAPAKEKPKAHASAKKTAAPAKKAPPKAKAKTAAKPKRK